MNRFGIGFIIKFVLTLLASYIAFGLIDGNEFLWVFVVAIVVTIINALIGDLVLLHRYGNVSATLADAIMAPLIAYIISLLIVDFVISWTGAIVFILVTALCEYLLHRYLIKERVD